MFDCQNGNIREKVNLIYQKNIYLEYYNITTLWLNRVTIEIYIFSKIIRLKYVAK